MVAVPATIGTEDPSGQQWLADGGLKNTLSQQRLASSANSKDTSDQSWSLEVIGAMGSSPTPKNNRPDSGAAMGAAQSPRILQEEFQNIEIEIKSKTNKEW